MKKIVCLVIVSLLLLSGSVVVNAKKAVTYEQLIKEHNLKSVSSCPDGITPLKFSSPEELEEYLKALKKLEKHVVYDIQADVGSGFSINSTGYYAIKELHKDTPVGLAKFNLWADGSFFEIISVPSRSVGLTGITFGLDLRDTSSYYDIASDKQSVSIKGSGIVDVYIIIEGIIKISSKRYSLTINWGS
ncbi:MAG: hypothetical protein KAX49_13940 [Halanaerobiales bacterium]|nr:hypothetical protein [Halanaerobiales bacterium]